MLNESLVILSVKTTNPTLYLRFLFNPLLYKTLCLFKTIKDQKPFII